MKTELRKAIQAVTQLDSWDITSVLGAVNYAASQAAINAVVKLLPDVPEGSGIEGYTNWEAEMRKPEIVQAAAPLVGLANEVKEVLNEYTDRTPSEFEDVLDLMRGRVPRRETFEADYNNRKRLGMHPGMPLKVFVDAEMATATARFNAVEAKGEAAVRILNGIDGTSEDIAEWLQESIMQRMLAKLDERWIRGELRRTNPRLSRQDRDLAAANQKLIESVMQDVFGAVPSAQYTGNDSNEESVK